MGDGSINITPVVTLWQRSKDPPHLADVSIATLVKVDKEAMGYPAGTSTPHLALQTETGNTGLCNDSIYRNNPE